MVRQSLPSHSRGPRRTRRQRGQALVEFALVLPVLLMIMFAVVDFGLAFDASIGVSNVAREGARLGVTNPSSSAIEARVRETAGRLNNTRLAVNVSCRTTSGASCPGGVSGATSGTTLVVTVTYSYSLITPIAFGTVIPVSSTAQMRVE